MLCWDHPALTGHLVGHLAPHVLPDLVGILRSMGTPGLQCHLDKTLVFDCHCRALDRPDGLMGGGSS